MKKLLFLALVAFFWQIHFTISQNTFHVLSENDPGTATFAGENPLARAGTTRVRYVIRASEFGDASPAMSAGDIVSLGFRWSAAPGAGTVENVNIRITHTSDDVAGTGHPAGGFKGETFQDVFSGDITGITAGQWIQVPFSTPFIWDGTSNVLVEICKSSGGSTNGTIQVQNPGFQARRSTNNNNGCNATSGALNANTRVQMRFEVQGITPCDGTPEAGTASILNNFAVCGEGSKTLELNGYPTSEDGIELQWKESNQPSGPYTAISGATENTFTTPSLTETTYYVCEVTCTFSGLSELSNEVAVEVNNPLVTSVTDGSNCGAGEVILEAEGNDDATLRWFESESGGNILGTGTSFTTPFLTESTTFYVEASSILGPFSGAKLERTTNNTTIPGNHGLIFTANSSFTINSVDVYLSSSNSGTLEIELREENGTVLQNGSFSVPAGNSSNPVQYTIPLNFDVPQGTNLRLMAVSGPTLVRDQSGVSYPYPIGGLGSVTAGLLNTQQVQGTYYYFYNWDVSSVCQSGRTPVEAIISCDAPCPVPEVEIEGETELCFGETSELNAAIELNGSTISTYGWTLNGEPVGTSTPTLTITETGTYQLTVTTDNGCEFASSDFEVTSIASVDLAIEGILEACEGQTTTLTAVATTTEGTIESYLWYLNGLPTTETDEDLEVSESGNYSVEVENSNGCKVLSNEVTVTIHETTTPEIDAEKTVICVDETIELTASEGESYLWSNEEITQTIQISSAGTYFVTVTDENGCSETSLDIEITEAPILDIPSITASEDVICDGSEITLTASEADNYEWSNGETTASITISAGGTYSVTISDDNGCTATSDELDVEVVDNPDTPTIDATSNGFCENETVTLTSSEADSYLWSNEEATPIIEVSEAGEYSVTVTDENGCSATSDVLIIEEFSLPNVSISEVEGLCVDDDAITLQASPSGGTFTGTNVAGNSFNPAVEGEFEVTYTFTDENNCSNSASTTIVVEDCDDVSVTSFDGNHFKLYPNPSSGEFVIELSNIGKSAFLEISSVTGRKVYSCALETERTNLNMSDLPNGAYFVRIYNGDSVSTLKWVKN